MGPMNRRDVLTADDPLYAELYDVRREAESVGNLIDVNAVMPRLHELRAQAPVHKGRLRELLWPAASQPPCPLMEGRQHWTVLTYEACEEVFRDPKTFSKPHLAHAQRGERADAFDP
jgi:cytochrome P450